MKLTSTLKGRPAVLYVIFCTLFLLTSFFSKSYAQTRTYANQAVVKSPQVENPNSAVASDDTFATVKSYGGFLFNSGKYSGELELIFPAEVPANTTTFVRIEFDPAVLNNLLGGNLGSALANLVGSVLLGNHYFEAGARNGTALKATGTSSVGFTDPSIRIIRDKDGLFYVAITPTENYDRIFIKDITNAVLVGATNQMRVYNAFYTTGEANCADAFATSFEGTGLTVDLLGVGKAGVTNAQFAIDGVDDTFSEISLGALGVAGSITQNVFFASHSKVGDEFSLRMRIDPALLSANVLNNIDVIAYDGNTPVFERSLNTLVNLDLLGLLNSNQTVGIPFKPSATFNRVSITLRSLLNVGLTQTISLDGIVSSAPRPTFVAPNVNALNICYNTGITLNANTAATNELVWYDVPNGGTALAVTAYNVGYPTGALTANKTFYVAARRLNCTSESIRVPITVTVNPEILFNTTTLANANPSANYSAQILVATGGTAPYSYAVTGQNQLPQDLTLSASGLLSGTPTAAGDYTFDITVTDSKNCTVTKSFTLKVTERLNLATKVLPNGTVGSTYVIQQIPPATGGTPSYIYEASSLPPGLAFDVNTREITGTPTTVGTYTFPVKVTDADGYSVTTNYTIMVDAAFVLPSAPLADGTVGTPYQTQTILAASGGTTPYTYIATGLPNGLTFDETTRQISGTPTTIGSYPIIVTATDGLGRTATANYNINVLNPLALPAKTLANGTVGEVYPTEILPEATGGSGSFTYTAATLPPGLAFNAITRAITGTPTQAGNYNITLTATDANGPSVSRTYTLAVIGALTLPGATLPDGTVNTVYPPQTLPAVTGGTGPYTYVASNLPPGLNFNVTTREITGTPTQGGSYTITIVATDAVGRNVRTDYVLRVNVGVPVVANATVCIGTGAVLNVSNLQTGVTYNWYASTGNTPLATNNTGTFTTPNVSANTTFYVEAVSGTAVSNRVAVNVMVSSLPAAPTINTPNVVISSGQTATLQATATGNNIVNWYDAPSGGNLLFTGSNYTTPALTATTIFYAGATNSSGCTSAVRTAVTVNVNNNATSPNCNAANVQTTGVNGLCVLCGIDGAGNSTDGDLTNFTTIRLGIGVGATGYQRLTFPSAGLATDSIRLDLALPTGLVDATVLGGITVNVLNGNNVVRTIQLNNSLISLRLLGGARFRATFLAGQAFNRVEVRFGGLATLLTSLNVYGAEIIYPTPTIATAGLNICAGTAATLSATPRGGTTIAWFGAASGGVALETGNTFTTPTLSSTTTYYIEVSRAGCANPERVPVVVNVVPTITSPVVLNAGPVCDGATATVAISNPDATLTYNWYEVATNGTPIFTGATFTSPALTANKTYYVEAVLGSCTSATRTAVNLTINPRPAAPTVTSSSSSINTGQTAVLTASSTTADVNFNWYATPTSTTPIFTGNTFVTPPLTSTTNYYVETVSTTTGCTSVNRVQVTVTVNNTGGPIAVPCEAAVAQTNGVSGVLAVLAGVINPELAIDDNAQTGSTLLMPVGVVAHVYQRLNFGAPSNIGDSVKVLLSSPGRLLSASVLGGVQISTRNNNTNNGDLVSINNALVRIELLSGTSQALITFVPTSQFDEVEVRLNSGLVGALTSINVNYAQRVIKAPTVAANNVSGCVSQPLILSVTNPVAGIVYKWYDENGVYQTNMDGTSFTIANVTGNTKYFVEATSATGCASSRTQINVTATPLPETPVLVVNNISTCVGNSVLLQVNNPQSGIIYKWYDATNTYLAGSDGVSLTVPSVSSNTTYTVEAVNACGIASAQRATATITVGTVDPPIVAQTTVSVTTGARAVLSATSSTQGAIFNWYTVPGGGTPVFTGATYITDPITANTSFYVETASGVCLASARVKVDVIVVPSGSPEVLPCGFANTTADSGVDGLALGSVSNPGLAVDNLGQTASSLAIAVGVINSSVFQRVAFDGGLSNIGDTLIVKLSSPGKLLSLAVLQSLSLTTYQGNNSNSDQTIISNPLISLELLSDNSAIILSYVPTARFDGVELRLTSGLVGALTSIDFNYALRKNLAPQVVANTATACVGNVATLTVANPLPGVVYRWYLENVYQAQDGITFQTPINLTANTYNYYVKAFFAGCESAGTKVVVTILAPPAPPVPTASTVTACGNVPVTLSVLPVAGVSFSWYDINNNLLVVNNNSYTPPANLTAGTYQYFVEATSGNSCTNSTRTTITLTVNPTALASDITVTGVTNLCGTTTTSLTATSLTVNAPVFKWYADASLANLLFTGAVFEPTGLTTTTNFYVTVSGTDKCDNLPANAKIVTVNVNPSSNSNDITVMGAGPVCAGNTVTLIASSTTVTSPIFTWYSDALLTQKVFEGASFPTPLLSATTTYYVTVKGINKCENTSGNAKVITVNVNPSAAANDILVNGNLDICATTQTVLTASSNTITNPVFTWYSDANLTNQLIVGAVLNTGNLTTSTTYYVTVQGDNVCEGGASSAKAVTVIVKPYAIAADITLSNANICAGSSATLAASSFTVANPVFTWYSDASLTTVLFTGPTYLTGALTSNTTYYVTVKGDDKCENKAIDAKVVTVTVNSLSTSTDLIVSGNTTICAGGTVDLTATSPSVDNPIFTWYADPALTNLVFIGSNYASPALFVNTTYYVTVKGDNKCENDPASAKVVNVVVTARPTSPEVATTGRNICSGESTTLTITNPQAGVTYEWYDAATGGNLLHTGTSFPTPLLTTATNYYVQAVNTENCANTSGRVLVGVTVTPKPAVPTVNSSNVNVCAGNTVTLTVTNPVTGATYNWFTTATAGTAVGTGTSFTTPGITANTVYYVEASNGECFASSRTAVNITVQALPIAPATVTAANAVICSGGSTTLNVVNPDGTLIYRWYANSSGGTSLAEGSIYTPTNITATTTYYVESVSLTGGCVSTTRTPVTVTVLPVLATPTVRVQTADASSVTFAWNNVDGATAYEISTDGGVTWTTQSGNTFVVSGLKPDQTVSIIVRAKGQIDCQTSANAGPVEGKSTNPFSDQLYIPNTFTPNSDGKNDVFLAYGNSVAKFKMRIYNQWGEFLFESNSLDTGWDGRYRGNLQPNGVYVYYIDVTFNGGVTKLFKGTITLLR
ncbi:MAG: T9SS type B sorting domain-containing protein [Flavobacteriales bacterium]|nr:MAG: T9SS type B sorting domain-containing protein [Flavobacteriales bacterium]